MIDYDKARKSMVDSQIHPSGIVSAAVLEAFGLLPRELFLPEEKRGAAYVDEDLPIGNGLFLLEPVVHARMVQAAALTMDDVVLNIGEPTGYSSAILSGLVTTVVSIESRKGQFDRARAIWAAQDICNIVVVKGDYREGGPEHAPYSVVFINGAVAEIPDRILQQLAIGGRLVTVLKPPGAHTGSITLTERLDETQFSSRSLFNAATPYLNGFEPEPAFVF